MPARPTPLPEPFGDGAPFTVAEALRRGVPRNRLHLADLHRPFPGIRATRPPGSVRELAQAYALRMAPAEFFSHTTAAVLHGMWLPPGIPERKDPIDVAVFEPARAPRDAGVRGHHLTFRGQHLRRVDGALTLGEVETWCQLADVLTVDELVVAADGLLQPGTHRPESLLRALHAAAALPGRRGGARLLSALELVRPRVRSPQESRLRLLIVRSGRPEPLVDFAVHDATGRFVAGASTWPTPNCASRSSTRATATGRIPGSSRRTSIAGRCCWTSTGGSCASPTPTCTRGRRSCCTASTARGPGASAAERDAASAGHDGP